MKKKRKKEAPAPHVEGMPRRGRPPGKAKFTRQEHFFLDDETASRLTHLIEATGRTKSAIIRAAIMRDE